VTTVSRFELILLLMAVVVGLELVARRIRMPPAAAFIVGGIALALIPGTPDVELDPDLALVLFLPPLLLAIAPISPSGGTSAPICALLCSWQSVRSRSRP
jgi:NhaP-type Na+/H+ or K+/H+ antiporter